MDRENSSQSRSDRDDGGNKPYTLHPLLMSGSERRREIASIIAQALTRLNGGPAHEHG